MNSQLQVVIVHLKALLAKTIVTVFELQEVIATDKISSSGTPL